MTEIYEKKYDKLSDYYQVRFEDEQGNTRYGVAVSFDEDALEEFAKGNLLIEDSTHNEFFTVPLENVTPLPCDFGGEYDQYVEEEYRKAMAISDAIEGIGVGKIFATNVADGKAFYEVVEVSGKTVGMVWRAFQGDRWVDPHYGVGGRFPIANIKRIIQYEDTIKKIFGKKS